MFVLATLMTLFVDLPFGNIKKILFNNSATPVKPKLKTDVNNNPKNSKKEEEMEKEKENEKDKENEKEKEKVT